MLGLSDVTRTSRVQSLTARELPLAVEGYLVYCSVIPSLKQQGGKTHYCALCKKAGMPEKNYISHSFENCFGKRSNQMSIKEKLGGALGNRSDAVKQYTKSEQNLNIELKALKEQNKMLYNIAKKSGWHCELKRIKRSGPRLPRKHSYSIIDSSSSGLDSDSSLSSDGN